jgi:hypothetical protein
MTLLSVVPILALLNLFGQRPLTSTVTTPAATLKVYSPSRVRGGLLYTSRFSIRAHSDLKKAFLVLSGGWMEQLTLNAIAPQPVSQASADGRLSLELGHIRAGRSFVLYVSYQVNPTNIGHRSQTVELLDQSRRIATVHRTITVFP